MGDDTAICWSPKLTMSDGKLVYDTVYTNKHLPNSLLVSSDGTYTLTSYAISTISTGTKDGETGPHFDERKRETHPGDMFAVLNRKAY